MIEDIEESKYYKRLIKHNQLKVINIKIDIGISKNDIYESYIIKKAFFDSYNLSMIAEDWSETLVHYKFPKYVIKEQKVLSDSEQIFNFFYTKSKLLTSNISTIHHYTGEIKRDISSYFTINEELEHLGIKSILIDQYIGSQRGNILSITPKQEIKLLVSFYKNIQPVATLILALTSFSERRRLEWYRCDGYINSKYIKNYRTRRTFYNDKHRGFLISRFKFKEFLIDTLKKVESKDIIRITQLLQSYLSSFEYSVNAKIVLWNSILEKILKHNFSKKNDKFKQDLLIKKRVYLADLAPMQDLINIRNDIAHGDDVNSDRLFRLSKDWHILIERVLLAELDYHDLHHTDVHVDGLKPYGLD